jgi:predicted nucleotidyltransferase
MGDDVGELHTLTPSLDRLVRVATALGDLRHQVVFIGGAVAPLLQTHPPFPRVRPTKDVDGVVASTSYGNAAQLHTALRARGFELDTRSTAHVHRWRLPCLPLGERIAFDLVPAGTHLGGTGGPWDQVAIDTATRTTLAGITFRHVSAPGFLGLKWAAHLDRGASDPLTSHDLEDLLALVAARPSIVDEVASAPAVLRTLLRDQAAIFLADPDAAELLDAHLNNANDRAAVADTVRERLTAMATR